MHRWSYILVILLLNMLLNTAQAQETGSISGSLLMLDDKTPHVFVPVQAMSNGRMIASTLSNSDGGYQFRGLKPGIYHLRCQTLDGYVYYNNRNEITEKDNLGKPIRVVPGDSIRGIDFHFPPFKKTLYVKHF
jgi:hypothetical protein